MENNHSDLIYNISKSIKKKEALISTHFWKYAARSALACVFLSLGVAIACAIADKGEHIVHGLGKILYAFMFSWSLVMIVYMNAELGTSNMMYMTTAVHRKLLPLKTALKILFTCILFNFIAGVITPALISMTDIYRDIPADHYLLDAVATKLAKPSHVQFIEGIFANIVVNIAVFMTMRMKDDAGKVISMIFIIYIFAFLGFEHVIANFATFSLAFFTSGGTVPGMDIVSVASNFLFSGLGNFVGGGICIGLLYSWLDKDESIYVD